MTRAVSDLPFSASLLAAILAVAAATPIAAQEAPQPTQQPGETAPIEVPAPPDAVWTTEPPEAGDDGDGSLARAEPQPQREVGADWPYYGGGPSAMRYTPLDQITRENVGGLERAWVYRTGDMPDDPSDSKYAPETTALKVDDRLYLCSAMNILTAVDPRTGEEIWRYDPQVPDEAIPYGASCRGVAYYEVPDAPADSICAARIIEGTLDARLIAVDAATGRPCPDFGSNGEVSLWEGIGNEVLGWYAVTAPPAIVRGIVVTGAQVKDGQAEDAPSGVVRGYDAVTGELAWAWDLGRPDLDGAPREGETYTRGTPNMWTTAVADEELGYVYLPLGNSSVDYYGANRSPAENEYATSLVALDATTGEPVWHFQTVHYDVWDYDLGSQPTLIDYPRPDGSTVPAVIVPSKQGDLYILDRRTGESLHPVEAIAAPTGGVEPDNLAPRQPASSFHSLLMPRLEEKDMWGATPLDQLWCRIEFRKASYKGIYTPPTTDRPFIQYPGYNGGSDWGSVAVDPERGIIVANYNDIPNYNRLLTRQEVQERGIAPIYERQGPAGGSAEGAGDPQVGAPYGIDVNAGWRSPITGMPCTQPPFGGIRAVDLATGQTLWDQPLGTARRNGPFGIPSMLPVKIGTPNNGGSVLTASGLVFIAAATDNLFRAIDIETGEVVWSDVLPAGGQANPTAYEIDGRMYVVIMAGGHHFMETPVGDYFIAYALPETPS